MPSVVKNPPPMLADTGPALPDTLAKPCPVPNDPPSARALTASSSVGWRVMRLMTPPIAWLPHSTDCAPRSTSMRAMLPTSRLPKLNPPPGDDGSFSFTPSISATVWSLSAPRMLTPVVVPGPPLRVTVTPGVWRSRSDTTTA